MEKFLKDLIYSVEHAYLPDDWQDEVSEDNQLVMTETGCYALYESTIETDCGCVYHENEDRNMYKWDYWDETYIRADDAVYVNTYINFRRCEIYTHYENDCIVYYNGEAYDRRHLDMYELAIHNGEVLHYDDLPYDDDEDEDEDEDLLWGYDSGVREKFYVDDDKVGDVVQFGIGFEIEKSEMPDFYFCKHDVYHTTGCVLERDSSVSDGFELKTATYNLMSPKTEERLRGIKQFCDIEGVKNAGGHVGFSMSGKTDRELLDLCSGWLPLIFAMYKKRLSNTYCSAKKFDDIKYSLDKMQAVRMRGNYLEFRLIASVKSFDTLLFRLSLFRIMAKHLGKSFSYILTMMVTDGTELNTLLRSDIYKDDKKFSRLLNDAISMNKDFIGKKITEKSLRKIQNKIICA